MTAGERVAGGSTYHSSGPDFGGDRRTVFDAEKCVRTGQNECAAEYSVCCQGSGQIYEGGGRCFDREHEEEYRKNISNIKKNISNIKNRLTDAKNAFIVLFVTRKQLMKRKGGNVMLKLRNLNKTNKQMRECIVSRYERE